MSPDRAASGKPSSPGAAREAVPSAEGDTAPRPTAPASLAGTDRLGASRIAGFGHELWALLGQLYNKAAQDNIFFLSGAIAFNIVVAIVPLILAAVGIAGLLLQSQYGASASEHVMRLVMQALPLNESLIVSVSTALEDLIQGAGGFVGVGALVLVWIATRLVGTLRSALREIFDLQDDRGIVLGKLFDMGMVVCGGTLLAVNVGGTIILQLVTAYGRDLLAIDPQRFEGFWGLLLSSLAFVSAWFMFVLIYRYLPARRIHWRIALISATFAAAVFEAMKYAFGWYVTNLAVYSSTYSNFATLFIFLLWIYYMSVAFVLGGEVGQIWALRRIRRRQKERLH